MGKSDNRLINAGNKKLLKLTELMSNYITLLSPPKKLKSDIQKFYKDRTKYEEIITEQNLTIQELQNEMFKISKFKQIIKKLNIQIKELENKTAGLENTLDSLSNSQSLKDLNIKIQTELKAKENLNNELTKELKALNSAYQTLSKKSDSLSNITSELSILKNKLSMEWVKNQELRQALQKERETIKLLLSEKKGLEYALRRLERRLTTRGSLRGLSIPIHHLEIPDDLTGKADTEIQEQIQTVKLELQKRLDRIKELEIRNKDLKEKLAKSGTRDLQLEVQRLSSELDARKGAIMGLESTRKKLMEQIETHQQRIADLQNKVMAQGKEIEEKNKNIKNLEIAVSSGVHNDHAREVIQNLQEQNRDLGNDIRYNKKIINSLEKNIKFLQNEMKNQKDQSYKLYNQTKNQAILIQKFENALKDGRTIESIDKRELESAKHTIQYLSNEEPSLDRELRERDRKINRLESYIANLKQKTEDLQFRISSRDVKINELTNILKKLKESIAHSKAKIIIRPPSQDEYRKTKVKL